MVIIKLIKLYFSDNVTGEFLDYLAKKQRDCVNFFVDCIREEESINIKLLQKKYYHEARDKYHMSSDMTQVAMFEAVRMARRAKGKRKVSPYRKTPAIITGRMHINGSFLHLPLGMNKKYPIEFRGEKLPEGKIKESMVKKKNGEWYCYLSIDIGSLDLKNYKRVMGVDLGIAKTAVVADWNGNNTRFFGGEPYRDRKSHYRRLRKELQSKKDHGNVYKLLKKIRQKESDWIRNENHKISREIVNMAVKNKRTIALESLTGITSRLKVNKKTRKMLKGWSFRQLSDFIKYKAEMEGITVVEIDPRRTSKTCSKCGYYSRSNRRTQNLFKCQDCNYETNADRNAAINIAKKGTELMA